MRLFDVVVLISMVVLLLEKGIETVIVKIERGFAWKLVLEICEGTDIVLPAMVEAKGSEEKAVDFDLHWWKVSVVDVSELILDDFGIPFELVDSVDAVNDILVIGVTEAILLPLLSLIVGMELLEGLCSLEKLILLKMQMIS